MCRYKGTVDVTTANAAKISTTMAWTATRLLTKDPKERLTAEEMMQHPWIQVCV